VQVKRQHSLSARNSASYKIPVSGLPNNVRLGVQKNRLNLSPDDVESILDPVVDKVIDLVRDQIIATKQSVNAVLLVGGFGQSNYLKERMRESLEEEFGVRILQPPNAWTVVVRGAVMMGLARYDSSSSKLNVISRAARKHYATEVHVTYDPSIHSAQAGRK
jgi:tRNA A37 threonylcarbamoyltransferase TsaD